MKRIIFVDGLLQIQNSVSSWFFPFFPHPTPPWGPFLGRWILRLFSGCKCVTLCVSFYFAWKVHQRLLSSSAWWISYSVWPFKVHPCGGHYQNSLISVVYVYGWATVHCTYRPHLVQALTSWWRFCWLFVLVIGVWASVLVRVQVPFDQWISGDIRPGVGMPSPSISTSWEFCFRSSDSVHCTDSCQRFPPPHTA